MRKATITALILISVFFQACGTAGDPAPPTPTLQVTATADRPVVTVEVSPTPNPTSTPQPARGLLIAPPGTPPWMVATVEEALVSLANGTVSTWETLSTLTAGDIAEDVQLVIALPPVPDLDSLIASAPATQFLAVGIAGLTEAPNLTRIGPEGLRPDQQAFLAGYLAAVITPDWRVGVISPASTESGEAARQGFLSGVRFFCGLCLPEFPPYAGYPLSSDLPPGADEATWRAAADLLLAGSVKTIYLEPSIDQEALRAYLAGNGITLIGSASPPSALAGRWAASIRPDIRGAMEEAWPMSALDGDGGGIPLPIILADVNESLVSPGRQRLVESLITDLAKGLIGTGVESLTGENQ